MAKKLAGLSFEQSVEAALVMAGATSRLTAVRTTKLAKTMARNGAPGRLGEISDKLIKFAKTRHGMTLGRYVGGKQPGSPDNLDWANLRIAS